MGSAGWVGCDDRFIQLEGRSSDGGHIARPIWENFFRLALADKSLGLDKNARFPKPDSLNASLQYDYNNQYEKAPPPGAEGADQGNGSAAQYGDTTKTKSQNQPANPY